MDKKLLSCPYCKQFVNAPKQDGLVMACNHNGGICPQTVYMKVMIEPGNLPSQTTAFHILYEELTGRTWPGWNEPEQPLFELSQVSYLTNDGYLVDEIPDDEVLWGIMFMRLKSDEKVLLKS